jgi:hypothetical protein
MHRISFAAFVLFLIAATNLVADEESRHDEPVRLTPGRNVKDQILKEIDQFGKDVKAKLGPKMLAHQPYIGVDGAFATTLKATTVEQVVDRLLARLKNQADHNNEEFLPSFLAVRRGTVASGSDLLAAPVGERRSFGPSPSSVSFSISRPNWNKSEKITFKVSWEKVDGRFKNKWNHNDVDEVYEVKLNATLRLGLALSFEYDGKLLMVIDHSVAKPIVTGWHTSLVASEGIPLKIIKAPLSVPAKSQDRSNGK